MGSSRSLDNVNLQSYWTTTGVQPYWTTTKLWKLTVVLDCYEVVELTVILDSNFLYKSNIHTIYLSTSSDSKVESDLILARVYQRSQPRQ
jgi:hypothetical protein